MPGRAISRRPNCASVRSPHTPCCPRVVLALYWAHTEAVGSHQSVSLTHLQAWRTGPHAHTRCTRLAREPTRGTLSPAVALGPDCWTHNTQLTGQLTRWRCIVGFSGTDTGEEGGAQGRGHRTHELISHPAPGAVARASAGVFGPAVWQAPGHRSAGRAFKPHPRSAPALRRDPARC